MYHVQKITFWLAWFREHRVEQLEQLKYIKHYYCNYKFSQTLSGMSPEVSKTGEILSKCKFKAPRAKICWSQLSIQQRKISTNQICKEITVLKSTKQKFKFRCRRNNWSSEKEICETSKHVPITESIHALVETPWRCFWRHWLAP